MTLPTNLTRDARNYVKNTFGIDVEDVPFDAIRATIEHTFEGGWEAYVTDFRAHLARIVGTSEDSPVKRKLRAKEFLRLHGDFKLKPFDEVLSADYGDDRVVIVVSIATVKEYHREDRVTGRETKLFDFQRVEGAWKLETIEVAEAVEEAHRRFGYVNTPERHEERKWQEETCYRPGTKLSPMDGPIRKLEMSHEEAYGKVSPSWEQNETRK